MRTTFRDAHKSLRNAASVPGLVVVGAAVLAFLVCVTNFALGEVKVGIDAAIVGLLALGAGLGWLAMDRRRIRQAERDWLTSHPAP